MQHVGLFSVTLAHIHGLKPKKGDDLEGVPSILKTGCRMVAARACSFGVPPFGVPVSNQVAAS